MKLREVIGEDKGHGMVSHGWIWPELDLGSMDLSAEGEDKGSKADS